MANVETQIKQSLNGSEKAVREMKRKATERLTDIAQDVNQLGEKAGQTVGSFVGDLRNSADHYFATGRDYAQKSHRYVKKNPEKSLLIGLGVGTALGGVLAYTMIKRRSQTQES